ncbi:MAG TPA: hypothetical protein VK717_00935 [Opitutaceae bacterium]|nr:hypothetical protein [Opitutaceae bacterium]
MNDLGHGFGHLAGSEGLGRCDFFPFIKQAARGSIDHRNLNGGAPNIDAENFHGLGRKTRSMKNPTPKCSASAFADQFGEQRNEPSFG